jgi:hypothetical protein
MGVGRIGDPADEAVEAARVLQLQQRVDLRVG